MVDDLLVSDVIEVGTGFIRLKRIHRTAEKKRQIVEASLVLGASIVRVARENEVNSNQVFQWRYEYRKGIGRAASQLSCIISVRKLGAGHYYSLQVCECSTDGSVASR